MQNRASGRPLFQRLEQRMLLTTFVVTSTGDAGTGTLRQAIVDANASAGADTINFSIGTGPATIAPASALPSITGPITINGTTQPGYAGKPIIEINGASAGSNVDGLLLLGGASTVKGLVVNRFSGSGIIARNVGNNVFETNFVGTDLTGLIKRGNGVHGILLMCNFNRVGGTSASQRNIISGNNGIGLFFYQASDNTVQGNYIGLGVDGVTAVGNSTGTQCQEGGGNIYGGTVAGAGNVISGNVTDGLLIYSSCWYNTVQGNLVGTDYTGTLDVGNGHWGIECQSGHNLIGGTVPGARNILSGNGADGIDFYLNTAQFNLLQGNYIGTDITGTKALGNSFQGVSFSGDTDVVLNAPGPVSNIIGGTTPAERNIISGNKTGIGIFNRTRGNTISGNWIGVDVTGTVAIPNETGINIFQDSTGNTIGGTAPGAGNVISNSTFDGINIGAGGTIVQGNILGLDPTGTVVMANGGDAILGIFSSNNTIGGTGTAAANVIVASGGVGVKFAGGTGNVVRGNYIGTNAAGTLVAGNVTAGVFYEGSTNGLVTGNVIANNGKGIVVTTVNGPGTGNKFYANAIYASTGLGIDLAHDGVTPNTPGGPHAGANNLQNFPVISAASTDGVNTVIAGALNSAANASFTIDLYSSPAAGAGGYGEGKTWLGSTVVTTDSSGNAAFAATLGISTVAGQVVSATATAGDGSTSEFSLAQTLAAAPAVSASTLAYLTRPHAVRFVMTLDVSASIDVGDLVVRLRSGGPDIAPTSFSWDMATMTLRFALPALPDGDYRATLKKQGVYGAGGVAMTADVTFDFFELSGDANRDRTVNFDDLVIVAQNYEGTGTANWDTGDFTGDGRVNFDDLVIVAQQYSITLPAPAAAAIQPVMAAAAIEPVMAAVAPASAVAVSSPASKPAAATRPVVGAPRKTTAPAKVSHVPIVVTKASTPSNAAFGRPPSLFARKPISRPVRKSSLLA